MHKIKQKLVVALGFALLAALLVAGVALAEGPGDEAQCAVDGGEWWFAFCLLPADHPVSLANCPPGKGAEAAYYENGAWSTVFSCSVVDNGGDDVTDEEQCAIEGGDWDVAWCNLPESHPLSQEYCPGGYAQVFAYAGAGDWTIAACVDGGGGGDDDQPSAQEQACIDVGGEWGADRCLLPASHALSLANCPGGGRANAAWEDGLGWMPETCVGGGDVEEPPVDGPADFCEDDGGNWNGENDTCRFPAGHGFALAACGADRAATGEYNPISQQWFLVCDAPDDGGDDEEEETPTLEERCEEVNGDWGADRCLLPASHAQSQAFCSGGGRSSAMWREGIGWEHETCIGGGGGGDEEEDGGEHEEEEDGGDSEPASTPGTESREKDGRNDDESDPALTTTSGDAGGAQSSTVFDDDACPGWCTVDPHLPEKAAASKPAGTAKTLYVRLVDENQQPYAGHYIACFNRSEVPNPVVYRYVEGQWIAIAAYSTTNTQICVSAYGDGSFALVND